MSNEEKVKMLKLALGTAVVSTLGVVGVANASQSDGDVFGMEELSSGYLTAGAHMEGGCGGDKEGGDDGEDKEGGEGSCGGDKEGGEGKCGEGKCGGDA
jgi:uncharacterized low-complexity protein